MPAGRRLPLSPDCPVSPGAEVTIEFEGRQVPAREGEPLAAALLAAGVRVFGRSIKYHRPRGPWCLHGHCSGCLLRVDDLPNVRSCHEPVRAGMRAERQRGWPSAGRDLLRAIDWLSGETLEHHSLFTSSALLGRLATPWVRRLAGFGEPPAGEPPRVHDSERLAVPVLVVGAGAAGLAAAAELAERGVETVVCERESLPGGRLLDGSEYLQDDRRAWQLRAELLEGLGESVRLEANTTVVAVYPGDRLQALVVGTGRTLVLEPQRLLLANGAYEQLPLFAGADLPGVMTRRALDKLFYRHGVLPAEPVVLWGDSPALGRLAGHLQAAGVEVAALAGEAERTGQSPLPQLPGLRPVRAGGGRWLERLELAGPGGGGKLFDCGLAVLEAAPAPAYELAHHAGCRVAFSSACGYRVVTAASGATSNAAVFAAGHCRGPGTIEQALEQGRRAAAALAESLAAGGEGES